MADMALFLGALLIVYVVPGPDMIDPRDRTRSGRSIAITWAIIPPIEAPTTWAEPMSSASSKPAESAAISESV